MKRFITLLLAVTSTLAYGQAQKKQFDLKEFTAFESNALRFDQIVPDSNYLYWKCLSTAMHLIKGQEQVVAEWGDTKYAKRTRNIYSSRGFLLGCGPGFCYNYIIA